MFNWSEEPKVGGGKKVSISPVAFDSLIFFQKKNFQQFKFFKDLFRNFKPWIFSKHEKITTHASACYVRL